MARFFGQLRSGTVLALALAASTTVAACSQTDQAPPPNPRAEGPTTPAEPALRRLLARQYRSSVRYLLGEAAHLVATPPLDSQLNGFSAIAASQLSFNEPLVASYESSARKVASAAIQDTARIDELVGCKPASVDDDECLRSFVKNFGRLAWRRPLSPDELDDYVAVAKKAAVHKQDFAAGIELVIAAFLQSPHFLYQVEIGTAHPERADLFTLTGFEVATRMSFLLLGRTPDAELLDAAERGELDTEAGVRSWAQKLVLSSEAKAALREFFSELFVLGDLTTVAKDPTLFPEFSPELGASMREETLRIIEDVIAADAPLTNILTADRTFVDDELAALYGIDAPSEPWQPVTLPSAQGRSGILTSAAIMSRQAHTTTTSATYRGLFVMERLLCTSMPPPPPDVVTTLPPSSAAPTLRDRLLVHQTDPVCRSCHYMADNMGLAFENFDAIGKFRAQENGAAIDASGAVDTLGTWNEPAELGAILAASDSVKSCLVRQVYRYAVGHVEVDGEWPALNELTERWAENDHRYGALLVDMVASDLFRQVGAPE